jgi:hypothetical protein
MIFVSYKPSELVKDIIVLTTDALRESWPKDQLMTFDEGFEGIRQSLRLMKEKGKLAPAVADQLLEMTETAKAHFEAGYAFGPYQKRDDPGFEQVALGAWLMQDMEHVAVGKPPFSYPAKLYKWPR